MQSMLYDCIVYTVFAEVMHDTFSGFQVKYYSEVAYVSI